MARMVKTTRATKAATPTKRGQRPGSKVITTPVARRGPAAAAPPKVTKDELRAQVGKLGRSNTTLRAKNREAQRAAKAAAVRIEDLEAEISKLNKEAAKGASFNPRPSPRLSESLPLVVVREELQPTGEDVIEDFESLEFPEHVWKEGDIRPALEVSIDFLPEEYRNGWHKVIHQEVKDWCLKHKWPREATIWMRGSMSVNSIPSHPDNPMPSWSDFLIQFGLPTPFWTALGTSLQRKFQQACRMTEMLPATASAGWTPICHVEQNRVWTEVDADTWEPFNK